MVMMMMVMAMAMTAYLNVSAELRERVSEEELIYTGRGRGEQKRVATKRHSNKVLLLNLRGAI